METLTREFSAAADEIPSVRACEVGANIGYLASNYDFAITIDFDDLDGYRAYVAHDLHTRLYKDHLEPYADTRVAVQFTIHG